MPIVETVIQTWYVELAYNNKNSPAYVDMVADMAAFKHGVFTCTFKINDGNICDYQMIERSTYADIKPPKID